LSSSAQRPAAERTPRSESMSREKLENNSSSSLPSMSESRGNWSPRHKRSRSFCCQRRASVSGRVFKAVEAVSPIRERPQNDRCRKVKSRYGEDKDNESNENIRDQKETLQGSRADIKVKHPRGRQYDTKGNKLLKYSSSRENRYKKLYTNKNSKEAEGKKLCWKVRQHKWWSENDF